MPRIPVFRRQQRESRDNQPREWISWKIRKVSLILMLAVTSGLIIGVSILLGLSQIRHGFVPVTNRSSHLLVTWYIGLTWTTVPSFLFQIYALGVSVIVTAFGFRQPFIELCKGATAEKSVALDYQSYFSGQNAYQAFKNGHWHLAIPFVISTLLTIVVGPLSARMISEQPYSHTENKNVVQSQSFFNELSLNTSVEWDLAPMIGLTSATTVYGGSYARTLDSWVDGDGHAFLNFSIPDLPGGNAYFSKLDCRVLDNDADDNYWKIDIGGDNATYGEFYANATDRGCSWSILFSVGNPFTTYLQTKSNISCGSYGASDNSGRLVIVGAQIGNLQISRLTMLSCIPTYWTSNGTLKLDLDQNSLHPIQSWAEENSTVQELRPEWWDLYEDQIHQISFVDTTTNFHADSTTAVGSLILAYSRRNSSDPLSGNSLVKSSEAVWQAMYGTTVSTFMLRSAAPQQFQAQLTTTTNRLVVSSVIAGIILGFLIVVGIILIFMLEYTKRNRSVLFEEPIGILGYANLLYDSELNGMIASVRESQDFCGKTTKDVMQALHRADVHTAVFRMEKAENPRTARIIRGMEGGGQEMTSLTRPVIESQVSETQISGVQHGGARRSGSLAGEISPIETETPEASHETTSEARSEARPETTLEGVHGTTSEARPEEQAPRSRLLESQPDRDQMSETQVHQTYSW